jgi:DNA-binding IclR family transcriptional regulator
VALRSASRDTPRDTRVFSVVKALSIIDLIAEDGPASLAELGAKTGLPKSTLFRLLSTICTTGFLERTPRGDYALPVKLWRIGARAIDYPAMQPLIARSLKTLVDATDETAHYSIYEGGYAVQVEKLECSQPIRAHTRIGGRSPGYASATGKALLAYQTPQEIERVAGLAERHTAATIVALPELVEELAEIRRVGFAFNRGEWRDGVWSVAAAVFDYRRHVVGSIGVSGPQNRFEPALEQIAAAVRDVATQMTTTNGGLPAGAYGSAA